MTDPPSGQFFSPRPSTLPGHTPRTRPPAGVAVFDMYGTLVATPHPRSVDQVLAAVRDDLGGPQDLLERWYASSDQRDTSAWGTAHDYWARLGVDHPELAAAAFAAASGAWTASVRPWATDQLDRLRERGWTTVVCSNAGPELRWALAGTPLASRFDAVVCSADHGATKPDPSVMHAALAAAGPLDDATPVVFVGDGGTHELAAAAALGWVPVQVPLHQAGPVDGTFPAAATDTWRHLDPARYGPAHFADLADVVLACGRARSVPVVPGSWCPAHLPDGTVASGTSSDATCSRCVSPGATPVIQVARP